MKKRDWLGVSLRDDVPVPFFIFILKDEL